MDKLKKFELMEKIVHEFEDLKNSQLAIIQKLGKIEVDNIELGAGKRPAGYAPARIRQPGYHCSY
jgi:hypothetical protein